MNIVNSYFIYSLQYEDLRELCADSRAKAAVLAEMDDVGKQAQVTPYLLAHMCLPFWSVSGLDILYSNCDS